MPLPAGNEHPPGTVPEAPITIPRASDIFVAVYNLHRDGRYWPDPDTFDPEVSNRVIG